MPGSPHDLHYEKVLKPWAETVSKESQGTMKIDFYLGRRLAHFGNLMGRIIKGVAHIGFGIHGPSGEPFPGTDVVTLPFISGSPAEVAPALWALYEKGLISAEYKRWKVLALFDFPAIQIHSTMPIKTAADLKGVKLQASNRITSNIGKIFGASPVTMAPPAIYQAISRGVIKGSMVPWTAAVDFKLFEVTKYHFVTDLGVPPAYVFMNKETYAGLAAPARRAIDKHSGAIFSKRLGKVVDKHGRDSASKIAAMKGQNVNKLGAAERARWEKRLAPITANWVKNTPNGANILKA